MLACGHAWSRRIWAGRAAHRGCRGRGRGDRNPRESIPTMATAVEALGSCSLSRKDNARESGLGRRSFRPRSKEQGPPEAHENQVCCRGTVQNPTTNAGAARRCIKQLLSGIHPKGCSLPTRRLARQDVQQLCLQLPGNSPRRSSRSALSAGRGGGWLSASHGCHASITAAGRTRLGMPWYETSDSLTHWCGEARNFSG